MNKSWEIMRPVRGRIRLAMGLAVAGVLCSLSSLACLALAMRELLLSPDTYPWPAFLGALACTLLACFLRLQAFNQSHYAAFRLEVILRNDLVRHLARLSFGELQALGLLYLDSPISGGAAKAASGQMTMMTAGSTEAYAKAGGVLEAMAANVYRLGDKAGNGSKVKIINQLLAGVHIAAAAEAMALGLREGVDPAALYEVITHSAGNSWMFENRMAHVLAGDYTPLSAVDIFVKDLGLVLDTARHSSFPLPLASTAHQMFMQASAAGHGREDDSAVIKIFPGITLPESA